MTRIGLAPLVLLLYGQSLLAQESREQMLAQIRSLVADGMTVSVEQALISEGRDRTFSRCVGEHVSAAYLESMAGSDNSSIEDWIVAGRGSCSASAATTASEIRREEPIGVPNVCTDEQRQYAESMGHGAADGAYHFASRIQQIVAEKDLAALFAWTSNELSNGPRRRFVQDRTFDEVFSAQWQQRVADAEPECAPVGWRGFMLADGLIWFNNTDDGWRIFSINGATPEPLDLEPWSHNDQLLTRACFTTVWISGDNYEEIQDRSGAGPDLWDAPGRYIGGAVSLDPIAASWGETVSIAERLPECLAESATGAIEIADGWVTEEACDEFSCLDQSYSVVRRLSRDHCASLAPNMPDRCAAIRLVETVDETGGSIGNEINVGIFAIVDDADGGDDHVVPLVNFDSLNDALNYVEDLEANSLQAKLGIPSSGLHSSLQDQSETVFLGMTENHIVRIDSLADGNAIEGPYRYAVWPAGSSLTAAPDLILVDGAMSDISTQGTRNYTFSNGRYRYVVSATAADNGIASELTVTNGDNTLLTEAFLASSFDRSSLPERSTAPPIREAVTVAWTASPETSPATNNDQPANTVDQGKWIIDVSINPLDDARTVALTLSADSVSERRNFLPVHVTARCTNATTPELYVNWNSALESASFFDRVAGEIDMITRVGSRDAVTRKWTLSANGGAVFYPANPSSFIRELATVNRLVAQIIPRPGEPATTAIFDVRGLSGVFERAGWSCP